MRVLGAAGILAIALVEMAAMQSGGKQIVRMGPEPDGRPFSPAVKAGGFIYLSGVLAVDEKGQIEGDVKAQTRRVLDRLRDVLEASGSSLARVASVTVYLKRAEDFAALNEVYRTYWTADPPARTTVVVDLVRPEALVEIAMVAIPNGGERRVIHPGSWVKSPNPYSYGIKSGDTLFLAGVVPRNGRDNSLVTGDIKVQTHAVMDNAAEILQAAEMSLQDVVSSRVYITDVEHFQLMNAAYRSSFTAAPPARATVRAGLMNPGFLVEITMLAVRGWKREAFTTPNPDGSMGRQNPNLSSAIRVGARLYVSGMLGNTGANRTDARAQTKETLVRIGRTLAAAGFGVEDVVDSTVYLKSLDDYAAMNEAYTEVFRRERPARATVRADLVSPDGLVEIMVTAVK
jgi:reactive intermediate/imine deaminase